MQAHPYADLFPLMTAEESAALAADIAANGLRQPIIRYQNKVLDGRNRLAACRTADVEPRFEDFNGTDAEALALVISLNVQRRDLSAGQRAVTAAKYLAQNGDTHGGDRRSSGKTSHLKRGDVGSVFKVSDKYVQQAKCLLNDAPDLAEQVADRSLTLAEAYTRWQERKKQSEQDARDARLVADFEEAIDAGQMTRAEALAAAIADERRQRDEQKAREEGEQIWWDQLKSICDTAARFIGERPDDYLAGYAESVSRHGELTDESVGETIRQLERVRALVFGASHVNASAKRPAPRGLHGH